jgi:hypothetical protein
VTEERLFDAALHGGQGSQMNDGVGAFDSAGHVLFTSDAALDNLDAIALTL